MNTIAYYRVSTDKQGRSGLGLEAQREAVHRFLDGKGWPPIEEYIETESGKDDDRPQLRAALAACRIHGATLVVAKVDRLTRSARFLLELVDAGVDVLFCDLPELPKGAAGRFMLQQMAAVAELEAGLISERTKAALAQAKARGKHLGGFRGVKVDSSLGTKARQATADRWAQERADILRSMQDEGLSLQAMARRLNERGLPTPSGNGTWQATTVKRVLARL